MNGNSGFLASMAVFRQLYNDRSNIFRVVENFIVDTIRDEKLAAFTLPDITYRINNYYSFDIPESIYKRSLKSLVRSKLLNLSNNTYNLIGNIKDFNSPNVDEIANDVKKDHKFIIESLYAFIESKTGKNLNSDDQKEVLKSFVDYFTNDSSKSMYTDYIGGFIISIKSNAEYLAKLNTIKEGIIIYSGISYGIEDNSISKLSNKLTIFLDQEILFSLCGLNGEIYRNLALEIVKFSNEINIKTLKDKGKSFIELRFLEETRKSVKNFFTATEHILRNDTVIDPDAIAMRNILENCTTPADVKQKEIGFFNRLEDFGIFVEDEIDYYSQENMKYNSISTELCKSIGSELNIKEDDISFEILNMISIRRKSCVSQNLFDARYILLTETSNRLKIARSVLFNKTDGFPITINTDLFVTHAWLILNKGFSSNEHPTSFDIVTKAQVTLATRMTKNIREQFDILKIEYQNGKMSREFVTQNIIQLRNHAILPEQISDINLDVYFDGISNLEVLTTKEILDRKDIEIKKAKKDIEKLANEKKVLEINAIKELNSKDSEILDLTSKLEEYLENEKKREENRLSRKRKLKKLLVFLTLVVIFTFFLYLSITSKFVSDIFGYIATFFSLIAGVYSFISFIKEFSSKK